MLIHYQKNIFLTFSLILFWTGNSYACSCEGEGTVAGSVKLSASKSASSPGVKTFC
jgi:hypothetical protein